MRELAHQSGAHGGLRELALFAGAGGGILGGHILGWRTVCAVEWDAYAIAVLCARQNEGVLPPFPIWDDVRTFNGHPWRGCVDVVSGGFPCTDISAAGKGAGIEGEASGLWREMARIVGEVRPRYVFVENSPLLVSRGLAVVLSDLAQMGYDARWGVLGAHHVGAPHRRDRIWIVAHTQSIGYGEGRESSDVRGAERGQDGRLHGVACGADHVAHAMCNGRDERRPEREGQRGRVALDGSGDVADANGAGQPTGSGAVPGSPEAGHDLGRGCETVADADIIGREQDPESGELRPEGTEQSPSDCWSSDQREGNEIESRREDGLADSSIVGGSRLRFIMGSSGETGQGRQDTAQDGNDWWGRDPADSCRRAQSDMGLLADGLAPDVDQHGAAAFGGVGRVATGVPNRVQRLKCIGNGQVPLCAAMAWQILTARTGEDKEAGE